ncbi:Mitochondrial chaperone BCS1 [Sphaceloma murrayae]|uniref:Mitochondrial chaperone BCS1 n=1 Tax=Sphaceloma murrayae TaxID=2082308 RepID=A0A2K1R0I7_9PEZI|nr:Mitochondrial chaperone BCS1 [Sphaceloma murrayae]
MADETINKQALQDVAPPAITAPPDKATLLRQLTTSSNTTDTLWQQLISNPLFTGGLGLAGLGAALRYGQQGLRRTLELIRHRMLVDLEITRHDKSYPWILKWMTSQYASQLSVPPTSLSATERLLRRLTPGLHHLQMETGALRLPSGQSQTTFHLVPGHGRHILRFGNAFLAVHRERVGKSFDSAGQPFETIKFTTLYAHRHIFENIFSEAHELASSSVEGKTVVYTLSNMTWTPLGEPRRKRPFESVVLAEGVSERILGDVREFLDARTWYLDRGIPYRRGYMLYGPPGTGKTSFVQALAGELDFNIAMLSLSQRGLHDDLLNRLLLNVPPRTIVLLEDADAAFANRRQREEDGYSGGSVTFSGLLNALDGVASAEERIVFMTTNHIERMDEALVRPGRIDMMVHLGNASEWQIEQMWDRFYASMDDGGIKRVEFMARAKGLGLVEHVSTAMLQMVFLDNKDDPEGAIETLQHLTPLKTATPKTQNQQSTEISP